MSRRPLTGNEAANRHRFVGRLTSHDNRSAPDPAGNGLLERRSRYLRRVVVGAVTTLLKYADYVSRIICSALLLCSAWLVSFAPPVRNRYRGIWLITERHDEARDNGFHLFRYLTTHTDKPAHYAIDPSSADYRKVRDLGPCIRFGSFRHYLAYILADVVMSTHFYGASPNGKGGKFFDYFVTAKANVFLRHGIAKDHYTMFCNPIKKCDVFVCGAKPEFDYLQKHCYDPTHNLCYTGFARFDSLYKQKTHKSLSSKSDTIKTVLFMPTFRKWIHNLTRLPENVRNQAFSETEYCKMICLLLYNDKLRDILEKYDLKLYFYPHYRIHTFINLFIEDDKVVICERKNHDIQNLITSSDILITDFSSVFFDFAFLEKPIIYYHFDTDEYRKNHYEEGYFSYEKHGFGPVCRTHSSVVSYLERLCQSGFRMEAAYQRRVDAFFPNEDGRNCERILAAIENVLARKLSSGDLTEYGGNCLDAGARKRLSPR